MILCAFEKTWRSGVHSRRFKLAFVRSANFNTKGSGDRTCYNLSVGNVNLSKKFVKQQIK